MISQYAKLLIVVGVDAYKALADPTRRKILKLLRDDEMPAGAIAEQFDMSWPSVSRHLSVLTHAGLVEARRQGQQVIYSLTTSVLADIVTELADMGRLHDSPRTAKVHRPKSSVPPKLSAARS
jgi:ArsR family transcriptional regulator